MPAVVKRLLDIYKSQKKKNEKFREFVVRVGLDYLKKEVEPLATLPETPDANFFADWGDTGEFKVMLGKGECAV